MSGTESIQMGTGQEGPESGEEKPSQPSPPSPQQADDPGQLGLETFIRSDPPSIRKGK